MRYVTNGKGELVVISRSGEIVISDQHGRDHEMTAELALDSDGGRRHFLPTRARLSRGLKGCRWTPTGARQ